MMAGFTSSGYAGGEQALGRYGFSVARLPAAGATITDTVEAELAPLAPSVRPSVQARCCLRIGGELAVEVIGHPGAGRFGSRDIRMQHAGYEYRLRFWPTVLLGASVETEARKALMTFLSSFEFVDISETPVPPTPPPRPAPTPTDVP
jgi:hypothetical protein